MTSRLLTKATALLAKYTSSLALFVGLFSEMLVGCLNVAAERAQRDERVGQGQLEECAFDVKDGLAAIRHLAPGVISLWAQAPTIEIHVRRGAGAPDVWALAVSNALPDATLTASSSSGEVIPTQSIASARPTEKRWSVAFPADGDVTLIMHPAAGQPTRPWRFALLSDVQEAIDRVQDIYTRINTDSSIQFVVSAGDLTRQGSEEELARFQRELERLRIPFFSTLGNHELGTDDGEPFQRFFGRGSFRFVHGGMQFTFLDSASATIAPQVYEWLEEWLAQARDRAHAVLMHIPPIDPVGVRNGSFANRGEASKLLAMLAEGDVDLTLYGHIHSYYAFSNAGIPAYISGGGGAIPERFDGIGRHFVTVDVDPEGGVLQTGLVRVDAD